MNPIIKKGLDKCNVVLPEYDDNTTHMFIPKKEISHDNMNIMLELDRYYVIKLERYILFPPDNFNLDSNWNKGVRASSEYMLVTPTKFVGKMTRFDGCGYDNDNNVSLSDTYTDFWLPAKGFKIVEVIQK